jgi:hypothetical protein
MTPCSVCRDLQVNLGTNLTAEETSHPESFRLRTFSISQTLLDWRQSAQTGCGTCRLIWEALCRFDKDSNLDKLLQEPQHSPSVSPADSDDNIYLELSGFLGHTLMLEFVTLPPETYFPALELFCRDGKHLPARHSLLPLSFSPRY